GGGGASSSSASPVTVKAASSPLGTILVDQDGKTLYLFEADSQNKSNCSGGCPRLWPPVVAKGAGTAGGGAPGRGGVGSLRRRVVGRLAGRHGRGAELLATPRERAGRRPAGFVRLVLHPALMATSPTTERVVYIRPRTILQVLGIVLATCPIIAFFYLAWHIVTWILVAAFLALALNPAVEHIERRGLKRGYAAAIVFVLALAALVGLGFLVLPPLLSE